MTNFDFLKKYQRLQDGIMYDKLLSLEFATVSYCSIDTSEFWNNALVNRALSEFEMAQIEKLFKDLSRKSVFYFENKPNLHSFIQNLLDKEYTKTFKDCWQFWNGAKIDNKYFEKIIKVNTEKELQIFLKTFDECYTKDDPQNPYGELGSYLNVAEQSWHKHNRTNRIEYFIVYKNDSPVAVSSLSNFENLGYISNVGSLKNVRGEGYGKAATLFCVYRSIENGNTTHCLATEEGHYPNNFYNKIGFETKFKAVGYKKN